MEHNFSDEYVLWWAFRSRDRSPGEYWEIIEKCKEDPPERCIKRGRVEVSVTSDGPVPPNALVAATLLEDAVAQGYNAEPRYLDLLEKISHNLGIGDLYADEQVCKRISQLMDAAPASPLLGTQIERFSQGCDAAAHFLRMLPAPTACSIMMRGLAGKLPIAVIRHRLFEAWEDADYEPLQRLFATARNAQFQVYYETLSLEELVLEANARHVTAGANKSRSVACLRQRLESSDAAWASKAEIVEIASMHNEKEEARQLFGALSARDERTLLKHLGACFAARSDLKRRRHLLHKARALPFWTLSEDSEDRLWLLMDLAVSELAEQRLRSEKLFADSSTYALGALQKLCKELGIKTRRHARRPDYATALDAFARRRKMLLQQEVRREEQVMSGPAGRFQKLGAEALEWLQSLYPKMTLEELRDEVKARRLSAYRVLGIGTSSFMRRPSTCSAPGPASTQLRKRLRDSDMKFQELCPDSGYMSLSKAELCKLASAIGISHGDGTVVAMQEHLGSFSLAQRSLYFTRNLG